MKRLFPCILSLLVLTAYGQQRINIIPKPASVTERAGNFSYNNGTLVLAHEKHLPAARFLAQVLNFPAEQVKPLKTTGNRDNAIVLNFTAAPPADSAHYRLSITEKTVTVTASHPAGALHACQSLAQMALMDPAGKIPCGEIADKPRFGYRGMMLDVSRNFYPVDHLKKLLTVLSLYKINTFHWHLTDGPGWRLEIRKYPELTRQAAWRTHNTWREWWNTSREYAKENDPQAYGGYYSQQQAREIVDFAGKLGITVIPEIEMPGHSEEVMAVYPHLRCTHTTGVPGEMCIGNDSTFTFMQDVITEVMEIFPSAYIHIGGDEAGKANWKKCSRCQQRIRDNKLKDEEQLQSYAIRRMEKFISSKGRKLLGWDEILEGGLAPGSTVMSWRGERGGIEAARMGHDVIMTPANYLYLDYYQQDPATQPEAIGGYLPLQKVYSYEPYPAELEQDKRSFIKGVQANVWTEYIATREHLEHMIFPRIIALSEVAWSAPEKNWDNFKARLYHHYGLLQKLNINYCRPSNKVEIQPKVDLANRLALVQLNTEQHQPELRYTTDGSMPGAGSNRYIGPFEVSNTSTIRAVVMRNGKPVQKPDTLNLDFHKALGKKITYNKPYNRSYPAQLDLTLVNGQKGSLTYQDGQWQGFTNDMDLVVDLGEQQQLSAVHCTFMQLIGPGVYMPDYIEVQLSGDGKNFTTIGKAMNDVPVNDRSLLFKTFRVDMGKQMGRYVRFFAKNHEGFLFADEIVVY